MRKLKLLFLLGAMTMSLAGCFGKTPTTDPQTVDDGKIHVTFDTLISLKTNNIKEQVYDEAHKVKKPVVVIIDENPDSLELYGWYKDKELTTQWNFKTDLATESMTLYAKFVSQYEVKYYQGIDTNSVSLLATELVFKGETVPSRDDLPDCYENPGNYYLNDVVTNDSGVTSGIKGEAVAFNSDIVNGPTNIFLQRSSNFYLSPGAISRRFTPVAANNGVNGSSLGKIEVINQGTEEEYAKVDFGTISDTETVVDPYILIDNPAIDVRTSEYIEIKMKNVGYGETLSFYWVGKWEINDQWINGKEYHSFAEDRRFAFAKGNGSNDYNVGTVYKDLFDQSYENLQEEDGEWMTYRLPISSKFSNGVSTWGCAGKITALRIQSSFNKDHLPKDSDKKNVLLIKYIKGVHDTENTYEFNDSDLIKSLLNDEPENLVTAAADAQTQVNGFIFPKNNNEIFVKPENASNDDATEYTTSKMYKKTDGMYFGSQYVDGTQKIILKPASGRTIILADEENDILNSTFIFRYKNMSYINKLSFELKVTYKDSLGNTKNKTITSSFTPDTRMDSTSEGKINYFGDSYFNGILTQLTISYVPIGIDNLIKFDYLKFDTYEAKKVNGFNFNDKNHANFTVANGMNTLSYDKTYKSTKVETISNTNSMFIESSKFDNSLMKSMTLTYIKPDKGISDAKISIDTNGHTKTYVVSLEEKTSSISSSFALNELGNVSKVSISFEGIGVIYLKSLVWDFVDSKLSFVSNNYFDANAKYNDMDGYSYDSNELGLSVSAPNKALHARLGARNYSIDGEKVYNYSMAGKSKIAIMYQNRSENCTNPYFSFGCVSKERNLTNNAYLTKDALPNTNVTLNNETKKPGVTESNRIAIEKNMSSGEWSVAYFNLESFYTRAEYEAYLSCFYFATASLDGAFIIRAFALI